MPLHALHPAAVRPDLEAHIEKARPQGGHRTLELIEQRPVLNVLGEDLALLYFSDAHAGIAEEALRVLSEEEHARVRHAVTAEQVELVEGGAGRLTGVQVRESVLVQLLYQCDEPVHGVLVDHLRAAVSWQRIPGAADLPEHAPAHLLARQFAVRAAYPGEVPALAGHQPIRCLDADHQYIGSLDRPPFHPRRDSQRVRHGTRDPLHECVRFLNADGFAVVVDANEQDPASRVRESTGILQALFVELLFELDLVTFAQIEGDRGVRHSIPEVGRSRAPRRYREAG